MLFLTLVFSTLIIICLCVIFFMFVLLGCHRASWFCFLIELIKFGKYLDIYYSNNFSDYSSESNHIYVKVLDIILLIFSVFSVLVSHLDKFYCYAPNFMVFSSAVFKLLLITSSRYFILIIVTSFLDVPCGSLVCILFLSLLCSFFPCAF